MEIYKRGSLNFMNSKNLKEQILLNLKEQLSGEQFQFLESKNMHLGIFTEPYLTYMLDGKKTIESRFSKNKIAPYEKIELGDIVLVKKSGGKVLAFFTIKEILFFDLEETPISEIRKKYEKELCVEEAFWKQKEKSRYGTLIRIDQIERLKPFSISKKGMQTWIKL